MIHINCAEDSFEGYSLFVKSTLGLRKGLLLYTC